MWPANDAGLGSFDRPRRNSTWLDRTIDKSVHLVADLSKQPVYIGGDHGQIEQALLNLAVNTAEAMDAGGGLTLRTEVGPSEQLGQPDDPDVSRCVRITVAATGPGIPEDVQERMYEPFFTTRDKDGGTELGLAMVYGTVKNHGDTITCDSEVGEGTTFKLVFPAQQQVRRQEQSISAPETGSRHILIIDDERTVAGMAADVLQAVGYSTKITQSAEEAIEYFRQNHHEIDPVLTEMVMPDMNGAECFRELRDIAPYVSAILTSGYGEEGQAEDALRDGMQGFIRKPFSPKDLSNAVNKALGTRSPST